MNNKTNIKLTPTSDGRIHCAVRIGFKVYSERFFDNALMVEANIENMVTAAKLLAEFETELNNKFSSR